MVHDKLYDSYLSFKGWTRERDGSHDRAFEMEIAPLHLPRRARIIEVGFGEGRFLDFARDHGFDVTGIEIIPALVDTVRARQHRAIVGSLSDLLHEPESYDLIVAFDLIEHIDSNDLAEFFKNAALLIRPSGKLLLRFPNGDSPFSLSHQNGDVTHRSYLNSSSLRQLAGPAGLRIISARNAARAMPDGLTARVRRRISYGMRLLIELIIGLAYFGQRLPMDANITVILGRPQAEADGAPTARTTGSVPPAQEQRAAHRHKLQSHLLPSP
jgi:2-polyprenyl-3-methyl-5-hydroxy-6-metoxy-1,4-benzoquinol methylase